MGIISCFDSVSGKRHGWKNTADTVLMVVDSVNYSENSMLCEQHTKPSYVMPNENMGQ